MSLVSDPTPSPSPEPAPTPAPTPSPEPNPTPNDPPKADPEPAPAPTPLTAEGLQFPEGFAADEKNVPKLLEIANKHSIPAEAANELVALHASMLKEGSEAATQAWQDTVKGWEDESRADQEIGGTKLDENLSAAKKLIDSHGSAKLLDVFNLTGVGSHPEVIRFLAKIAKEVNEPGPVSGAPVATAPVDAASTLYPNQGKA